MEETKDIGAGRPLKYESAEALQAAIDDYFNPETIETQNTKVGTIQIKGKREPLEKPTITGLALHLGFASRQSLYDYEERGEFSYTIKAARLKIESMYEARLYEAACTGAIFALKNFGWEDKQTTKHQGDPDAPVFFQLDPRFGT